jgi:hypothetical protein
MVSFINQTGTVGMIYTSFTQNVTGSEFLTLLGMLIMILLFFIMFKIPIEASIILVLPLFLIAVAYSPDIFTVVGVILIYLGVLLAKNFPLKG